MGVFNKTIIPLALVGYEMTIACLVLRPHYYARPIRFGSRGPRKFLRPRQPRRSETFCFTWGGAFGSGRAVNSELKIRRRRDSTTADLVEGVWGEVAVAMARKIALRKLARRRVVVAPFPLKFRNKYKSDGYF